MSWTLREIDDLFRGEGFAPGPDNPDVGGQRRSRVEQYYASVDWASPSDVGRVLRVFEEILAKVRGTDAFSGLAAVLHRDGFEVHESGRIESPGSEPLLALIARHGLPSGVRAQIDRIQASIDSDPEAAIGAAKELIEATTKYVLAELGVDIGRTPKLPELVRAAQSELGVHPEFVAPDQEGYETIRVILGSLAQVAIRINDLRGPYGTGHGRPERPSGLAPRHARLAAGAAAVYCRFLLDTIDDPNAPWRTRREGVD